MCYILQSFERVVVQNILHGLSPSLCEAIQSLSRWKVIQASFPHLMHACASLITACKRGVTEKFGSSETKLLYTLHWIILDAASECADVDADKTAFMVEGGINTAYLHSMSTIQLFVYLFAPIVHLMKPSDFESLKLENGLKLWQPLWDYQQPDIPCFAAPVKPQRSILKAQRNLLKVNTNAANIYVGKGTSRENLAFPFGEATSPINDEGHSPNAPLARMSDICTLSTNESLTATMEVVCEHCSTVMPVRTNEGPLTCRCGRKDTLVAFLPDSKNYAYLKLTSTVDKDYVKQTLASAVASGTRAPGCMDILSASYLDVAVLRCLFCLSWQEDGIYWALRYIHKRMLEVCDELERTDRRERSRSLSLPIPDLQVLLVPSEKQESADDKSHSLTSSGLFVDSRPTSPYQAHQPDIQASGGSAAAAAAVSSMPEYRKEPPFKKIHVTELKQFFESGRTFRKKDSVLLEKASVQASKMTKLEDRGHLRGSRDDTFSTSSASPRDIDVDVTRPSSAMASYSSTVKEYGDKIGIGEQRMSLPMLSQIDKESVESSSQQSGQDSSGSSQAEIRTDSRQKPIIKITEHSPEPRQTLGSNYQLSSILQDTDDDIQGASSQLPRSFTDSNIKYQGEKETNEVAGSKYYIQENGHLNYMVVLRAVHFVSMSNHVPRISEVLLNILNCLLDLNIIETQSKSPQSEKVFFPATSPSSGGTDSTKGGTPNMSLDNDSKKDGITAHSLAMDSLLRCGIF